MSRYTGPKNRLSRREGLDLFGKGHKLRRNSVPPGQHGPKGSPRRQTNYGLQLREKQKVRRVYGIIERQFRKYFEKARKQRGATGEILLQLLETRLDNVVYRTGLVPTRAMARQLISHGHVRLQDQKTTSPSHQVSVGQLITLDPTTLSHPSVRSKLEDAQILTPPWITRQGSTSKIEALPTRDQIDTPVDELLIVEYYSNR